MKSGGSSPGVSGVELEVGVAGVANVVSGSLMVTMSQRRCGYLRTVSGRGAHTKKRCPGYHQVRDHDIPRAGVCRPEETKHSGVSVLSNDGNRSTI